jgi:hypothetical protein
LAIRRGLRDLAGMEDEHVGGRKIVGRRLCLRQVGMDAVVLRRRRLQGLDHGVSPLFEGVVDASDESLRFIDQMLTMSRIEPIKALNLGQTALDLAELGAEMAGIGAPQAVPDTQANVLWLS